MIKVRYGYTLYYEPLPRRIVLYIENLENEKDSYTIIKENADYSDFTNIYHTLSNYLPGEGALVTAESTVVINTRSITPLTFIDMIGWFR